MITTRVGYAPVVRQSAPQRQNVAFRGVDYGEPERLHSNKRQLTTIAAIALTIAGISGFQKKVSIPNLQAKIVKEAKSSDAAKKIIAEGQKLTKEDSNRLTSLFSYREEKGYLEAKLDSIQGKPNPVAERLQGSDDDVQEATQNLATQMLFW